MPETVVRQTTARRQLGAQPVTSDRVEQIETVTNGPQEQVVTSTPTEDYALAKLFQVLWFITHFIAVLLFLRFVFYLLGANPTGIVLLIYTLSDIFVLPFRGIFPSPRTGEFFFDSAAILGILMYYLLMMLIWRVALLFSRRTEV